MVLKQTILACFLACGLSAIASTAHATIVRLHSSVTVDKALIHLGDVAGVHGCVEPHAGDHRMHGPAAGAVAPGPQVFRE